MSSPWTVDPEVDRYELDYAGRAFWIDLKRELTAGEQKRIESAAIQAYSRKPVEVGKSEDDESRVRVHADLEVAVFRKVHTWLVDWSLADEKHEKLKRDLDTLRALRAGLFSIIERAVDRHQAAVQEREKKVETPRTNATSESRKISA